jgi:DNA-binding response OmpR family regulator
MPGKRILLVEDEDDLRAFLALGLRSAGYAVDVAATVAEGDRHLARQSYALVLADWRLPDGNGIDLADRAAQTGARTIIASGYLFALPAGARDRHELMIKPFRTEELVTAVQKKIGTAN